MDFELDSARVALAGPKSIIISSKYGEFGDFWNSDFGWTPTVLNLVGVRPKNIYCVEPIPRKTHLFYKTWSPVVQIQHMRTL
jgi:hypothetical protein